MAYASNHLGKTAQLTLEQGAIIYDITEHFQVEADPETESAIIAIYNGSQADPKPVPLPGTTATTPFGVSVYCDSVGPAAQPHGVNAKKIWFIDAHFTNRSTNADEGLPVGTDGKQIQDPLATPQQVEFIYQSEFEPLEKAECLGVFDKNDNEVQAPPTNYNGTGTMKGSIVKPCSTTKESIYEFKARKTKRGIRVTRVVDRWLPIWGSMLEPFKHKNASDVTITEQDFTGQPYSETFEPETLLFESLQKRNHWVAGKLYYFVTFSFLIDKATMWDFRHPDMCTHHRIWQGKHKVYGNTAETYTLPEVEELDGKRVFLFGNWASQTTRPANGWGSPIPYQRTDGPVTEDDSFYTKWLGAPKGDFSVFGIT